VPRPLPSRIGSVPRFARVCRRLPSLLASPLLIVSLLSLSWAGEAFAALVQAPHEVVLPANGGAVTIPLRSERAMEIRLQLERSPVGVHLERAGRTGWTVRWSNPEVRYPTKVVLSAAPLGAPTERERVEIRLVPQRETSSAEREGGSLQLPRIAGQALQVGKPWALWVRARTDSGVLDRTDDVVVALDGAPEGVDLQPHIEGWHRLAMVPRREGDIRFDVVALHRQGQLAPARQPVRLRVRRPGDALGPLAGPPPDTSAPDTPAPDTIRPDEPSAPLDELAESLQMPRLEPIANQIVSAGRAVVFRVNPQLPEGQRAVVQIDRLPRNARFDAGADGRRTFHWMTGESDQGEHRFRLTAINAEDANLRYSEEVTVIVGDPTRSKTAPAQ